MRFIMQQRIILIALLVFSALGLKAQVTIEDFDPGRVVLSNGDTLSVLIKEDRDEKMCRQIQVWDKNSSGPKRYLPKDLKFFTVNKANYYSLKDEDGKSVFMQAKIEGEATLFGYTYREDKGKKEIVTDYYIKKKGGGLIKVPSQAGRFKTDMALYFADFPQLSEKISNKQYGYHDMEAVTEEYNEWVKAGKPKNDERFVADKPGPKLVNNKPQVDKGNRVGIDVPIFASYNFISYPTALNQFYSTKTMGFGFDVGLGARIRLVRGLTMRAGINMRDKGMKVAADNFTLTAVDQNGNSSTIVVKIREQGRMYYPGLYLNFGQEWSYFHVGGGFNLSFYSFYRGNYSVESQSSPQVNFANQNAKGSFIVNGLMDTNGRARNFNMQFDINFTVGGRIPIGEKVVLKPTLMYSIPMVPLYNSGIKISGTISETELNVSGYQLKFGLITDIGF